MNRDEMLRQVATVVICEQQRKRAEMRNLQRDRVYADLHNESPELMTSQIDMLRSEIDALDELRANLHYYRKTGRVLSDTVECPGCEGIGLQIVGWDDEVKENIEGDCETCKGTGKVTPKDAKAYAMDRLEEQQTEDLFKSLEDVRH